MKTGELLIELRLIRAAARDYRPAEAKLNNVLARVEKLIIKVTEEIKWTSTKPKK